MAQEARILVVDDEPKICQFLEVLLRREGYAVASVTDAHEALRRIEKEPFDLVITDLKMPGMDGFELVRCIKAVRDDLPVVMITGYATVETAVQALRHGVDDYVTKPFNIDELRKVLARALQSARAERENRELQRRCVEVLQDLARALEAKDRYIHGHSQRVGEYACDLARVVGAGREDQEILRIAAALHDLGKLVLSETILDKPGKLTDGEQELLRSHPAAGERFVERLDFLRGVQPIIRHHHERMDGSGYPDRLAGSNIPRLARMLSIADAFDAMTSDRPYRPAMTARQAANEIRKLAGVQFDAELADAFCAKVVSKRFPE